MPYHSAANEMLYKLVVSSDEMLCMWQGRQLPVSC